MCRRGWRRCNPLSGRPWGKEAGGVRHAHEIKCGRGGDVRCAHATVVTLAGRLEFTTFIPAYSAAQETIVGWNESNEFQLLVKGAKHATRHDRSGANGREHRAPLDARR